MVQSSSSSRVFRDIGADDSESEEGTPERAVLPSTDLVEDEEELIVLMLLLLLLVSPKVELEEVRFFFFICEKAAAFGGTVEAMETRRGRMLEK